MKAEWIEKIEEYLEGRISREELRQEAKAWGIEDLEKEIQWVRDSQTAIEAAGVREQLKEVLPDSGQKNHRNSVRTFLAIAASVAIIMVAIWGIYEMGHEDNLYAEYEYVDPGLPVLMSQSDDHLLYDALTYYSEERYAIAEEKLREIKDRYPNSDTLQFYLGASLLYQEKPQEAREELYPVLDQVNSPFRERTQWLLVLSALQEEDHTTARRFLQPVLSEPEHQFHAKAKSLQPELSKE